mgnify:CR=1 FL=1
MFKIKDKYNIAIIGATGIVGESLLDIISTRKFPINKVIAVASKRSEGSKVKFGDNLLDVIAIDNYDFKNIDIAFFSAGSSVSKEYAPIAAKAGAIIIDNTSEFRYIDDIPLIVPEVNAIDIAQYEKTNIIANPNCSTIQMVVVLKPIHDKAGLRRIVVSTYQAVSGAGKSAMDELGAQIEAAGRSETPAEASRQIAFNCLPQIDVFLDGGDTKEEQKMVNETRKILGSPKLPVSATCVRVPVYNSHSESVNVETEGPLSPEEARELLSNSQGIEVVDDPDLRVYPTALLASGQDPVYVGRIRRDSSVENALNMWIVSDNLRKGAALNAVQIAEALIEMNLLKAA